jgi:hypothetical protein
VERAKVHLEEQYLSVMDHRVEKTLESIYELLKAWPNVSYRDTAKCVGRIVSMKQVFMGKYR